MKVKCQYGAACTEKGIKCRHIKEHAKDSNCGARCPHQPKHGSRVLCAEVGAAGALLSYLKDRGTPLTTSGVSAAQPATLKRTKFALNVETKF